MITSENVQLFINQGSTFNRAFTWKDENAVAINLTGFSAKMQFRFNVNSKVVLAELSTLNGKIVLGGVLGTIELIIPALETTNFNWTKAIYDLELQSSTGEVFRVISGNVVVSPEVTK